MNMMFKIYGMLRFLRSKENLSEDFQKRARVYFGENEKRLAKAVDSFFDEESKNTYQKMIEYRKFGKKAGFINYHGGRNIYFRNNFFKYGKDEVLIDCGAFNGDSIEKFLELSAFNGGGG